LPIRCPVDAELGVARFAPHHLGALRDHRELVIGLGTLRGDRLSRLSRRPVASAFAVGERVPLADGGSHTAESLVLGLAQA